MLHVVVLYIFCNVKNATHVLPSLTSRCMNRLVVEKVIFCQILP